MLNKFKCILCVLVFSFTINAHADLISTGNNPFYYQMGGGQDATAAIAEFPMYAVARADPDLYNLLNNALLGARQDLELSI